MNDREKIKSIREILSVYTGSFTNTEEVVIIRKILDGKMTRAQVEKLVMDNF